VLLWGNTAEEIWRPPAERMLVIKNEEGLDRLRVEDVTRALQKLGVNGL